MKILVVSHSCVIDVNQRLLVELAKYPDVQLGLAVPHRWRSDIRGGVSFKRHPELGATFFPMRVVLGNLKDKNVIMHFYLSPQIPIKKFKPDIVYIQEEPWSTSAFQFTYVSRGVKKVFFTEQNICKKYPPPFSHFEKYVFNNTDAAIAVSGEVSEVLRKKGYRKKIYVIPHGVDLSLFQTADVANTREILRRKYGLYGVVVGYMGRITREKGIDTLIEAMHLLTTCRPSLNTDFCLAIIGDGPYKNGLRRLIGDYELARCVKMIPAVPHGKVPPYLGMFDITVLPSRTTRSWREQFGRVLIESMALGIPVVGSSSGEIPNIIEGTGGGVIFEEGNAENLKEKLWELIRDGKTRRQLGQTGKENMKLYSYARIAGEHGEVFKEILGGEEEI